MANRGVGCDCVLQPAFDPLRHIPSLSIAMVPCAAERVAHCARVITGPGQLVLTSMQPFSRTLPPLALPVRLRLVLSTKAVLFLGK